jgi:hypothetical protein
MRTFSWRATEEAVVDATEVCLREISDLLRVFPMRIRAHRQPVRTNQIGLTNI